jgi:hypothetical protein
MPPGAVHVREDENVCEVTSIVFATVVMTLGVACAVPLGVVCPFSTSIGLAVSTLKNVWIPPADPVDAENVHV